MNFFLHLQKVEGPGPKGLRDSYPYVSSGTLIKCNESRQVETSVKWKLVVMNYWLSPKLIFCLVRPGMVKHGLKNKSRKNFLLNFHESDSMAKQQIESVHHSVLRA